MSSTSANSTAVSFNGAPAQITSATPSQLIAQVPVAAKTGLITLTAPGGTLTTATAFTVINKTQVSPSSAILQTGDTLAFTLLVSGAPVANVQWSVNGVVGGNSSVGTISSSGQYIAPATVTSGGLTVDVRGTSLDNTAFFADASVKILDPSEVGQIRAILSVARGANPGAGLAAGAITVQRGPNVGDALLARPVSVTHTQSSGEQVMGSLSVEYGTAPGDGAARSRLVSLTNGPVINSVAPAALTHGTTTSVTLTGGNLANTSAVVFVDPNGFKNGNITASNITPSADGTTDHRTPVPGSLAGGTVLPLDQTASPHQGLLWNLGERGEDASVGGRLDLRAGGHPQEATRPRRPEFAQNSPNSQHFAFRKNPDFRGFSRVQPSIARVGCLYPIATVRLITGHY